MFFCIPQEVLSDVKRYIGTLSVLRRYAACTLFFVAAAGDDEQEKETEFIDPLPIP